MAKKKDESGPDNRSAAYEEMLPKWARADTLLGGTEAMREAEGIYLPQHAGESDASYKERLGVNYLFNMFELTLDALVGRPFSDAVKLNDDVPESIVNLEQDINLQGDNISVFAREWFRDGVAKSLSHVIIDMPAMDEEERKNRTKADDDAEARRPYWIHVIPENVLAAYSEIVNGVEVLTHVRVSEVITKRVDFEEVEVETIRVMEPGTVEVYEKRFIRKGSSKFKWVSLGVKPSGINIIPMVTFYADRTDFMTGRPPLDDLAFLNIRHWQSNSDQINVTTVARFPMLAVSGATDETGNEMKIGPRQMLGTRDANGKFYYVEHTGKAIEAGAKDLMAIEEQMAAYGAEFLRRRPGGSTATARALDSAESVSSLQDMIIRFIDAMDNALKITAKWLNEAEGGTVNIAHDFGPETAENVDLRSLNEARRNRDLSRDGYLNEMKRRGALAEDFDNADDLKKLQEEPVIVSPFATGANVSLGKKGEEGEEGEGGEGSESPDVQGSDKTGEDGNDAV